MSDFANIISNNNSNFEHNYARKIEKITDNIIESYIFRKHINVANDFIHDIHGIHSNHHYNNNISPLTQKSQVEELKKLQSEISTMENKIKELEATKNMKLTKVKII